MFRLRKSAIALFVSLSAAVTVAQSAQIALLFQQLQSSETTETTESS